MRKISDYSPKPDSGKGSYSALARNIAIVMAAMAFTYSQLAPHFGDKEATVNPVQVKLEHVTEAHPIAPTDDQASTPKKIDLRPGELDIGTSEQANEFRNFIATKTERVNKAGQVVYMQAQGSDYAPDAISAVQPISVPTERTVGPVSVPQAAQIDSPAINAADDSKELANGPKMTKHPAPFVDQQAMISIQQHRNALIKSGQVAIVKIGVYVDGVQMPENVKREQIRSTLSTIPDEWTITYKAPNEKLRIYAFTDPTCPYCKKLHNAVPELLEAGISVHYLLYPRDLASVPPGQLSANAENLKNAWCSTDQASAINDAFAGYKIPPADCAALPKELNRLPAPVPDHYMLGDMFNVSGTPTLLASNGQTQVGFGSAQQIIRDFLN